VIACELSALTEAERVRRAELADVLRTGVVAVTDLPSGYAFHLERRPALVAQVEELVALERRCCSFLSFATAIDAASDRFVLSISGGPGVREFIAAQFSTGGRLTPKEES
jgi:hypothetical protein